MTVNLCCAVAMVNLINVMHRCMTQTSTTTLPLRASCVCIVMQAGRKLLCKLQQQACGPCRGLIAPRSSLGQHYCHWHALTAQHTGTTAPVSDSAATFVGSLVAGQCTSHITCPAQADGLQDALCLTRW